MNFKYILRPITLFFLIFLFAACEKDSDNCTVEDSGESNEKNDCVEYKPTIANGNIDGEWSVPNEKDTLKGVISIPGDAGGGYVRVSVKQGNMDLRPAMIVKTDVDDDTQAAIISGSSSNTNNELIREAYFSVHPGMTYDVVVFPFYNADKEAYPVKYNFEWEFFSRIDCFEPNDAFEQAKQIILGETITAYAIAGVANGSGVGAFDPNTYDWYKVKIDTAGILQVSIKDMPTDLRITLRLFIDENKTVSISEEKDGTLAGSQCSTCGQLTTITSNNVLQPGTYYIELHHDNVVSRKSTYDTDPIPEHFNKTYSLTTKLL